MLAFRQRLFRQNSLNQHSPKFLLAKVSSFTVIHDSRLKSCTATELVCEIYEQSYIRTYHGSASSTITATTVW